MKLLDGALHSVVFGRTNALRLNVDVKGARETKKGYASVTTGDVLELLGVDQSCVEVWLNTREGGEANERYHVNVLIDNQKLEKPAPPKLEALASLIQDYNGNTGDKVDHTRDRSTWRTVISARDADGRTRPGERIQLWATEHVEVEFDGRKYHINPNHYQSFTADEKGELTVAITADDLKAPSLSVWAGFMHRDERYTIPLSEGANDKLSKIKPDELSQKSMTNWKTDYKPDEDGKAIAKSKSPHSREAPFCASSGIGPRVASR